MEDRLTGNKIIEDAIAALHESGGVQALENVAEAFRKRIEDGAELVIPVMQPEAEVKSMRPGKQNSTGLPDLRLQQMQGEDGKRWNVAFTSLEEANKGQKSTTVTIPMENVLNGAKDFKQEAGIVINPFGKMFLFSQELIAKTLAGEKTVPVENKILFDIGDITKMDIECIVNAANSSLLGGGGVDGAIHRAAGKELLEECRELHGCKTGQAKITKGYRLKAKHIIHTVGPVYHGKEQDAQMLAACYQNSLDLAREKGIHSIAFPAISTGIYGYPKEEAATIALAVAAGWIAQHRDYGMVIVFSCFDRETYEIYQKVLKENR